MPHSPPQAGTDLDYPECPRRRPSRTPLECRCVLAVVLWIVASATIALYVASFGSYNRTYGAVGGVIVFLVWLWLTNIAILLGAEFNAERARSRNIQSGHPADESRTSHRAPCP